MAALFDAIDVAAIATAVGATGVAIVGYTLVIKGISIAKRLIGKA